MHDPKVLAASATILPPPSSRSLALTFLFPPRLRGGAQVEDRLVWDWCGAAVEARLRLLTTFETNAYRPEQ